MGSKRYYVCDVILADIGGGDFGYIPVVRQYAESLAIQYSADESWALVMSPDADVAAIALDPQVVSLPDFGLDVSVTNIPAEVLSRLIGALAARGLDTSGIATAAVYRDIIRAIGLQASPAFRVDQLK